jgi:hypothetical protein
MSIKEEGVDDDALDDDVDDDVFDDDTFLGVAAFLDDDTFLGALVGAFFISKDVLDPLPVVRFAGIVTAMVGGAGE